MRHTLVLAFLFSLAFLGADRGPLIDPDGGTTNVDAGCAMDPNGCSGRNFGARIDDNG